MGNKDNNNELNLILEQLKKSYNNDLKVNDSISEENEEPDYKDDDFQNILLDLFADENKSEKIIEDSEKEKKKTNNKSGGKTAKSRKNSSVAQKPQKIEVINEENDASANIEDNPLPIHKNETSCIESDIDKLTDKDLQLDVLGNIYEGENEYTESEIDDKYLNEISNESISNDLHTAIIENPVDSIYTEKNIDNSINTKTEDINDNTLENVLTDVVEDETNSHCSVNAEEIQKDNDYENDENNILNQPIITEKRDEATAVENVIKLMFANRPRNNVDDETYITSKTTNERESASVLINENTDSNNDIISKPKVIKVEDNTEQSTNNTVTVETENPLFDINDKNVNLLIENISDDNINFSHSSSIKHTGSITFDSEKITDNDDTNASEYKTGLNVQTDSNADNNDDEVFTQKWESSTIDESNSNDIEKLLDEIIARRVKQSSVSKSQISPTRVVEKRTTEVTLTQDLQGDIPEPVNNTPLPLNEEKSLQSSSFEEHKELESDDISLLLDLGYDEDLKVQVNSERTEKVKHERRKKFEPEKHNNLYGYCGYEFTDKTQINEIKNKYDKQFRNISTRVAILSVISLMLVLTSLIFYFNKDLTDYRMTLILEAMLVFGACMTVVKELFRGVTDLFKFEPNVYSAPAIISISFFVYDLFLIIASLLEQPISRQYTMTLGIISSIFCLCALLSDLAECASERMTFITITSSEDIYTAENVRKNIDETNRKFKEKGNFTDKSNYFGEKVFRIRKTSFPAGYFNNMSQRINRYTKFLFLYVSIPLLAVITGCISFLITNDMPETLSTLSFVSFMGFPLCITLFSSLPKYVTSKNLALNDSAIIGEKSSYDYEKPDTIIFDDKYAIEVINSLEIKPENHADVKKSIRIASKIFTALGGPIAQILSKAIDVNDINTKTEIEILSVSDSGIELYMDSSTHVIIGDRSFLASQNIRVRADEKINLSVPTKGKKIIYLAIDSIPRLGYIVDSKIKDAFIKTAALLESQNIKTAVQSHDPTVNNLYFEQKRAAIACPPINVYKTTEYESPSKEYEVEGGIMAVNDYSNAIYPIIMCKKQNEMIKNHSNYSILFSIVGTFLAILITCLSCFFTSFEWIRNYRSAIVLIFQVCSIIPLLISSSNILSDKTQIQSNKKQKK